MRKQGTKHKYKCKICGMKGNNLERMLTHGEKELAIAKLKKKESK